MVEVVIVTAIILASVLSVMGVAQKTISMSRQSLHISESSLLLEEGSEIVRILRDNSWNNISALNNANTYYTSYSNGWSLSTTPSSIGIFTRTINISSVKRDATSGDISNNGTDDPNTKLFTVTVTWDESGNSISKTISFYITNIFS